MQTQIGAHDALIKIAEVLGAKDHETCVFTMICELLGEANEEDYRVEALAVCLRSLPSIITLHSFLIQPFLDFGHSAFEGFGLELCSAWSHSLDSPQNSGSQRGFVISCSQGLLSLPLFLILRKH